MIDSLMYMPQFDVEYMEKVIVRPLSLYEKMHDDMTLKEIQNAIKLASMMVSGFRDILDDLNFNEDKLRVLQFNLDDNYDAVESVMATVSDPATKVMIEKLLTDMAKLDMEIGDLILEHTHAS